MLEEGKVDREIAKLENRAGKMQNLLDGKVDNRSWFQINEQRKVEEGLALTTLQGWLFLFVRFCDFNPILFYLVRW